MTPEDEKAMALDCKVAGHRAEVLTCDLSMAYGDKPPFYMVRCEGGGCCFGDYFRKRETAISEWNKEHALNSEYLTPAPVADKVTEAILIFADNDTQRVLSPDEREALNTIIQAATSQQAREFTEGEVWKIFNDYISEKFGKPTSYAPEFAGARWMKEALASRKVIKLKGE